MSPLRIGQRRARPRWSRGARCVGLQPIVRDALCVRRKVVPEALCVLKSNRAQPGAGRRRGSPGVARGGLDRLERTRERRGSRRAQAGRRETVKAEIHVGHGRSQTRVCRAHSRQRKARSPCPKPPAPRPDLAHAPVRDRAPGKAVVVSRARARRARGVASRRPSRAACALRAVRTRGPCPARARRAPRGPAPDAGPGRRAY